RHQRADWRAGPARPAACLHARPAAQPRLRAPAGGARAGAGVLRPRPAAARPGRARPLHRAPAAVVVASSQMGTEAAPIASPPRAIDPSLRIGAARLAVSDLGRSVDFYARALGLPLIARDEDGATLGPDRERPTLALARLEHPSAAPPHSTGLFHLAFLHPSRTSLAAPIERLIAARRPI